MLLRMAQENTREVLARRVRQLMDASPALDTQDKLAARCGIAQSTVGRILRCEVAATLDNVQALARAFGVPPGELVGPREQLRELDRLLAMLPAEEVEKIEAYARFVHAQYSERHGRVFNLDREETHDQHRARLTQQRHAPVFNAETNTEKHDEGESSKAPGPTTAQQKSRRKR